MGDKEVRLSSKNQIVIPKEARESIHLKAGDRLLMTVSTTGHLLLWKRPKKYVDYMKGLGKNLWKGMDIEKYVKTLRKEWN